MIYEVAPGKLIETDYVLDEDELAAAKMALDTGEATLEKIATQFEGSVHTPLVRERRTDIVSIPREEYIRLLRAAGELEDPTSTPPQTSTLPHQEADSV